LWFGLGDAAIAYIIFLAIFFPVLFNTREGFRLTEKKYLEAAKVLGADRKRIFWEVRVPSSLPFILVGVRVGLAFGWRALVAGEMIAGSSGLGYMIFDARAYLRADVVIVGMLAIGVSWFIIDKIFLQTLEDKTVGKWKE
jgi:ABC-type nitrate/sulfonate/bicarbonate transport system permease component